MSLFCLKDLRSLTIWIMTGKARSGYSNVAKYLFILKDFPGKKKLNDFLSSVTLMCVIHEG